MGFKLVRGHTSRYMTVAGTWIGEMHQQADEGWLGRAYRYGEPHVFETQIETAFFILTQMALPKVAGVS